MAYNKAIYKENTIFDLSEDTVNENKLLSGVTAHNNMNVGITGELTPVLTVNGQEPDLQGDVEVGTVKSVNGELPDSSGNVEIQAGGGVPTGGTSGQIIVKQSSSDGDASWEDPDYMYVDELGVYSSATPINADLLEGSTKAEIISSSSPELLWTNPNPTAAASSFSATFDYSAYRFLIVVFKPICNGTYYSSELIPTNATNGILSYLVESKLRSRSMTLNSTGATFGQGLSYNAYGTGTADSYMCSPYRIYGVK